MHNVTKQVEYSGEMMELTESLSHLPAGGQVLLSDTTCQRTAGRLHEILLPAFTFQCPRTSLETAQSRPSFAGLRPALSKGLVSPLALKKLETLALRWLPCACTSVQLLCACALLCTWRTCVRQHATAGCQYTATRHHLS